MKVPLFFGLEKMEKLQMKTGQIQSTWVKEAAQYAKIGTVESVRFLAERVGHIAEKMYQTRGQEHV